MECIPHPYDIYTVLAPWHAVDGCRGPPLHCYACAGWGWIFGGIEVDLSPSDVVRMSWLRLKPPVECIPHPYWIYTKFFTTLICYEWAYGSALTLVCLYRSGVDFHGNWGIPEPDWCYNVIVEAQTHLWSAFHIHMISVKCFTTLTCYEWAYGSTLTLLCLWTILGKLG